MFSPQIHHDVKKVYLGSPPTHRDFILITKPSMFRRGWYESWNWFWCYEY